MMMLGGPWTTKKVLRDLKRSDTTHGAHKTHKYPGTRRGGGGGGEGGIGGVKNRKVHWGIDLSPKMMFVTRGPTSGTIAWAILHE